MLPRVRPSVAANQPLWNHDNTGNPGLAGADVAAKAAWIITKGRPEIRVAVIDEGVDTDHPALKAAVVAEKDFVDGNPHVRPDGNDAHGTACAGIVVSRDTTYPGLAPACSLVAVRIAKGDGKGNWIFDDFDTADAIDWAWNNGKADVLSNSWGGGPAVDVITRAIDRAGPGAARARGRSLCLPRATPTARFNFRAPWSRSSRSVPPTSGMTQVPEVEGRRNLVGQQFRQATGPARPGSADRDDRYPGRGGLFAGRLYPHLQRHFRCHAACRGRGSLDSHAHARVK